jgi:hypothetical protein
VLVKDNYFRLGIVAHVYNPNFLGDRDWEGVSSRQAQVKSEQYAISTRKTSVLVHIYDHSYMGNIGRRIKVQVQPSQKARCYVKYN